MLCIFANTYRLLFLGPYTPGKGSGEGGPDGGTRQGPAPKQALPPRARLLPQRSPSNLLLRKPIYSSCLWAHIHSFIHTKGFLGGRFRSQPFALRKRVCVQREVLKGVSAYTRPGEGLLGSGRTHSPGAGAPFKPPLWGPCSAGQTSFPSGVPFPPPKIKAGSSDPLRGPFQPCHCSRRQAACPHPPPDLALKGM